MCGGNEEDSQVETDSTISLKGGFLNVALFFRSWSIFLRLYCCNSGDMAGILMIAVQALEKHTAELKEKEAQIAMLAARVETLELRQNQYIQPTAEKNFDNNVVAANR